MTLWLRRQKARIKSALETGEAAVYVVADGSISVLKSQMWTKESIYCKQGRAKVVAGVSDQLAAHVTDNTVACYLVSFGMQPLWSYGKIRKIFRSFLICFVREMCQLTEHCDVDRSEKTA